MARRSQLEFAAAARIGRWALDALFATIRVETSGRDSYLQFRRRGENVIFALWHGRLLPLTYHHRREGIVALVSEHADGEYIARIIRGLGYGTVRGSSTRGALTGLRGLTRAAREGRDLAITPDGPQGPRGRVKPGVVAVAQLTGRPIVPTSAAATRAWWLGKWDRFLVPKPFSRLYVAYGEPMFVSRGASEEEVARCVEALQDALDQLTDAVDTRAREAR